MSIFNALEFDDHEQVAFCRDASAGLTAIIAIHNTRLGPAVGGCRMWPYGSEEEALTDVLRLSRGMSYKSALANLNFGGGKSVIIGDPRRDKGRALLRAFGHFVDGLCGRYIVAEDVGTTLEDMQLIRGTTRHVAGIAPIGTWLSPDGDPSPGTAFGVYVGIERAVRWRLRRENLNGVRVAIQGVGNVGWKLAKRLHEAGAKLTLADVDAGRLIRACDRFGAEPVECSAILDCDVDVFAPCALGAVIDDDALTRLRAPIVAGSANNQLAHPRHGEELCGRGILYAPDYVINAGGIIEVWYERTGDPGEALMGHLLSIGDTLETIFDRAEREGRSTAQVADRMAEERLCGGEATERAHSATGARPPAPIIAS
jgi:leucine dehydrogenase